MVDSKNQHISKLVKRVGDDAIDKLSLELPIKGERYEKENEIDIFVQYKI
jgi:hypothetical protein